VIGFRKEIVRYISFRWPRRAILVCRAIPAVDDNVWWTYYHELISLLPGFNPATENIVKLLAQEGAALIAVNASEISVSVSFRAIGTYFYEIAHPHIWQAHAICLQHAIDESG
jgi:hypothetical protein